MSESKRFKVNYERGVDGAWSAQITDPDGAETPVDAGHSYRTAKSRVRKALEEALGSEQAAEKAEVVSTVSLPAELAKRLESLRRKRQMLDMLEQEVRDETIASAQVLLSQIGLPLRDAAPHVGLSFQRLAALMGDKGSE